MHSNSRSAKIGRTALRFWARGIAACLLSAATSWGALFSNFEPPAYTNDTTYVGVDGWRLFVGSSARATVSPFTDLDTLTSYTTVLEGAQSGVVKGTQVTRGWNGLESLLVDGVEITWLMEATDLTRTEVFMSDDIAVGSSILGIILDEFGNIKSTAPNSGTVDSGFDYLTNRTYSMSLTLDFTLGTMTATAQNLTDAGPVLDLGTLNTGALNIFDIKTNGGLYVIERDGVNVFYDSFSVSATNLSPGSAQHGLVEPDNGATWKVGSEHAITWSTGLFSQADTISVSYSVDGGTSWESIAEDRQATAGTFLWTVPDALYTDAQIRLSIPAVGNYFKTFDIIASCEADYSWTKVTNNAAFPGGDGKGALVFNSKMWLLGGWNPSDGSSFPKITSNDIWSSSNGLHWVLEKTNTYDANWDPAVDWEGRHTAGYAVKDGSLWIVGGDANQGHYQNDVWKSSNGFNWTMIDSHVPWSNRVLHYTVTFDSKLWVMGGQSMPLFVEGPDAFYRDIWNTSDGSNWTQVTPQEPYWSARGMIGGQAVFNDRIWMLGGGRYDTPSRPREYYNDVWSSADGITWKQHTTDAPWDPRQYHQVLVFDNRIWVIEGYNTIEMNDVWYSDDGDNWYSMPFVPFNPRHASSVFSYDNAMWYVSGMERCVWKLEGSAPPSDSRQVIRLKSKGFENPILLFMYDYANPVSTPHRISLFPGSRKTTLWDNTFLLNYYDGVVDNNARFNRDQQDAISFVGWENGGNGYTVSVDMSSTPLPTITLTLMDTDSDGTPNLEDADDDGDGMPDDDEGAAGTDPLDAGSLLKILTLSQSGATVMVQWMGGTIATQFVEKATAITSGVPWRSIFTNLPPTVITNSFVDSDTGINSRVFYRISVPYPSRKFGDIDSRCERAADSLKKGLTIIHGP